MCTYYFPLQGCHPGRKIRGLFNMMIHSFRQPDVRSRAIGERVLQKSLEDSPRANIVCQFTVVGWRAGITKTQVARIYLIHSLNINLHHAP